MEFRIIHGLLFGKDFAYEPIRIMGPSATVIGTALNLLDPIENFFETRSDHLI